ncbi:8-amino-7-oxononanoate synthase [Acinetobacter haemolyticus]|uniref:8-amino-7-oxononanoate synthase n=2 Tax=Acinetobacter haemolyticus TaxID=29430 RepID=A0AAJ2YTG4_ACIHA|nr:8-amino-7-oxononanoate synthase [Acinetobacter haemolyticus]ENW18214.1 8-amino-7-oxononanoate synthase [Acinetobacter haemolyticus CIP 64.3 = MTCC 9819]EPR89049.1 8-amino-7-oxononanoate synthase [Acinetobacter haemolyticus CIP 64.3 = MTCC 9819]MQZ31299.1 8-amino-7-oxononanoate synthase [Acinetobacter haemolyticus]NAR18696.1 aminotransferase class I/II-fold pyridoxal phosphate-dependent enzyme [Acinetobacter haemolyticus]NAR63042.1 aminotransferase class I/II-fold pyridoxal phosphate-depende
MSLLDHYAEQLDQLKQQGNFRQFTSNQQQGRWITIQDRTMLNLASNDYLGLAADLSLREEFLDTLQIDHALFSSSSSRLLTGNYAEYEQFENSLSKAFGRAALLFNSGYHMNIGILPALADSKTVILADKLVHASMIDGIRLSNAQYVRYRHNDLQHLEQLLQKYQQDEQVERIIVVTESIFSMDGDETDLAALVQLKQRFVKTMLYVDEAHAIGVRGEQGLGCAEQYGVLHQIDFLVGTFGKAIASIGGYIICDPIIRDYLINKMRPLIFSTALPPISMAWSDFIFNKVLNMQQQRQHLAEISHFLQQAVIAKGFSSPSSSHIIPIIVGESNAAIEKARYVQQQGFYAMPVRPPTVPQNSSRLRISLTSMVQKAELEKLVECL